MIDYRINQKISKRIRAVKKTKKNQNNKDSQTSV